MPALQSQTTTNMLLCISSQGLTTVHDAREPPSPVIQESPLSVLNVIVPILLLFPRLLYQAIQSLFMFLHILLFFPDLLYQALKSLSNSFTYPFAQPLFRVAKGSKHEPQGSNNEATPASLEPPMEFDGKRNTAASLIKSQIIPSIYKSQGMYARRRYILDNSMRILLG